MNTYTGYWDKQQMKNLGEPLLNVNNPLPHPDICQIACFLKKFFSTLPSHVCVTRVTQTWHTHHTYESRALHLRVTTIMQQRLGYLDY